MKNSSKHLPQSPTYRRGRWVSPGRYPAIQSGLLSLPTSPSGRRSCCGCACPMTSHKRFPIGLNAPRSSLASDGGNETCRIRPEGRWHMTPSPRDPGGGLGRLGSAQQPALWVRILCRSRHRSPTSSSEQATARSKPTSRDWWKSFHDATLNQLTDIAYNQNLTLLSAGTRVLRPGRGADQLGQIACARRRAATARRGLASRRHRADRWATAMVRGGQRLRHVP